MFILIHGKAGCGKDTLANKIMALAPRKIDIKSFALATPIKAITKIFLPVPIETSVDIEVSDAFYDVLELSEVRKRKAASILKGYGLGKLHSQAIITIWYKCYLRNKDIMTRREADITLGTAIGRNMIEKRIWCDIAWAELDGTDYKIVPDIRWKDEYDFFKYSGEECIKIKLSDRNLRSCMPDHESEAGLPDELFDFVIPANITLDGLNKFCLGELNEKLFD